MIGSDELPASEAIGRRSLAAVLDLVVCLGIAGVIGNHLPGSFSHRYTAQTLPNHLAFGTFLRDFGFLALSMILYSGLFEAIWRRTPGKAIFGLRVKSADGNEATRRQIYIRNAARIIDLLPMLYLLGFLAMLSSGRSAQRIGDRLARTQVRPERPMTEVRRHHFRSPWHDTRGTGQRQQRCPSA